MLMELKDALKINNRGSYNFEQDHKNNDSSKNLNLFENKAIKIQNASLYA